MASPELTRRDVLGIMGATALGVTASGFGARAFFERSNQPLIPHYFQENFPVDEALFLPSTERNATCNPLYRAANVLVSIGAKGSARASLIDTGNEYVLSTAEHVANAVCQSGESFADIPGIGRTPLDPERFIFGNRHGKERETAAFYVFGIKSQEVLFDAVTQKELQPLKLKTSLPRSGELVAIPGGLNRNYNLYRNTIYLSFENLIELESVDENCKGDSGAPILEIKNAHAASEVILTGYIYGTLQGASHSSLADDTRECSHTIYARPND